MQRNRDLIIKQTRAMLQEGLSLRKIAKKLLGSASKESNLRRWLREADTQLVQKPEGAQILFIDIETAPALVAAFGRRKIFLTDDHIVQEGGFIICYAFAWAGVDQTIHSSALTPSEMANKDDSRLLHEISVLFEQADAVVAHYGNKFDIPMINTRLALHRMPPLPTVKLIDTKIMAAKRFNFPTNSLKTVAQYLGVAQKSDPGGITTWIQCLAGNQEAINYMEEYNINDIKVLMEVYFTLARFGHSGSDYNAGLYYTDGKPRCAVCGHEGVEETGRTIKTAVSVFPELRCGNCGAVSRGRKAVNTKEQRAAVIVTPKFTG